MLKEVKNSGVFSITDVAVKQQEGVFSGSYEHIETKTASAGDGFLRFENLLTDRYDIHYYTFANFDYCFMEMGCFHHSAVSECLHRHRRYFLKADLY